MKLQKKNLIKTCIVFNSLFVFAACVSESTTKNVDTLPNHAATSSESAPKDEDPSLSNLQARELPQINPCVKAFDSFPVILNNLNYVILKVEPNCTKDTRPLNKKAKFLLMGFLGAGGLGRIEIEGNYYEPKKIRLHFSPQGLMSKFSDDDIKTKISSEFPQLQDSEMIGKIPFSVQYAEMVDYQVGQAGQVFSFYEGGLLHKFWMDFKAQKPIRFRLYGVDNSWQKVKPIFVVDAILQMDDRLKYKLDITSIKELPKEDVLVVQERCSRFNRETNCRMLFAQ